MKGDSQLGDSLLKIQKNDFEDCLSYLKKLTINDDIFSGDNLLLTKHAHKIAFTMSLFIQKTSNEHGWAKTYLERLKFDAIQLLPSILFGNRRTLHLYERACIEDVFQYIYYYDHKVEHIIFQNTPTKYESIDFLITWVKNYPAFSSIEGNVIESCNNLLSTYKEISRTIHGNPAAGLPLGGNLSTLFKPLHDPAKENEIMNLIFGNIFFLLSLFCSIEYQKMGMEEKKLVCQHLSANQKEKLSSFHVDIDSL